MHTHLDIHTRSKHTYDQIIYIRTAARAIDILQKDILNRVFLDELVGGEPPFSRPTPVSLQRVNESHHDHCVNYVRSKLASLRQGTRNNSSTRSSEHIIEHPRGSLTILSRLLIISNKKFLMQDEKFVNLRYFTFIYRGTIYQ